MQRSDTPVVRVVATPADMNINNGAFGGWVLSLMDQAGAVTGVTVCAGPVATIAVNDVAFEQRIDLGDIVSIYTDDVRFGTTSVTVSLQVLAENPQTGDTRRAAVGKFVLVAVDADGAPRNIDERHALSRDARPRDR
jgi:acyl-CoA thioesterase YciA